MSSISSIQSVSAIDTVSMVNKALGIKNGTSLAGLGAAPTVGGALELARTDTRHFRADGSTGSLEQPPQATFEDAMLKAIEGVNAMQLDSAQAIETMMTDPDSIDPHDVTISMAKANMSLNIARTVLERVVSGWKNLVNMN